MSDNETSTDESPEGEEAVAPAPPPPRRGPGHRGQDVRDTMAEMAAKAHEISLEAGSKMASAMRDVIGAAAGLTAFAIESARDLVQYMVRRGQMTQDEADKLMRDVETAHGNLPKPPTPPPVASPKRPEPPAPTPPPAPPVGVVSHTTTDGGKAKAVADKAKGGDEGKPAKKGAASTPAAGAPAKKGAAPPPSPAKPATKAPAKPVAKAPAPPSKGTAAKATPAKPAAKAPAKAAVKKVIKRK